MLSLAWWSLVRGCSAGEIAGGASPGKGIHEGGGAWLKLLILYQTFRGYGTERADGKSPGEGRRGGNLSGVERKEAF